MRYYASRIRNKLWAWPIVSMEKVPVKASTKLRKEDQKDVGTVAGKKRKKKKKQEKEDIMEEGKKGGLPTNAAASKLLPKELSGLTCRDMMPRSSSFADNSVRRLQAVEDRCSSSSSIENSKPDRKIGR